MAASKEWQEWHLTPAGWVSGSSKTDFDDSTFSVPRPADAVMTCRSHELISSIYSRPERWTVTVWEAENDPRVRELLTEHGPCPP